jgi:hypothetical protein
MPDKRRVGEIARVAARQPLRTVLGLIATAVFAAQMPLVIRRQRRRYQSIARRLGLTDGQVLQQAFAGGMTTPQLTVIALRQGEWPAVLAALSSQLASSSYRPRAPESDSATPPRRLSFRPPRSEELPGLLVSVYGAGETIEHFSLTVPAGQTGLEFSLA